MGCVFSSSSSSSNPDDSALEDEQHELTARRQFQSVSSQEYNRTWTFRNTDPIEDDDGDEADERKKKATIFWETIHAYGGAKDCWTALEVALTKTEDIAFAREILNASGMKVCHKNALACFDERGFLYSIPRYALAVKAVKVGTADTPA